MRQLPNPDKPEPKRCWLENPCPMYFIDQITSFSLVRAYYLANQEKVKAYIALVRQRQEEAWQEQQHNPSPFVRSLQERLAAQRQILEEKGELPLVRVIA
jgi:hypothetical protein